MTFWRSIRGPLLAWLMFTVTMGAMIYRQMGRVQLPRPRVPGCEMVTVEYVSHKDATGTKWGYWRQETLCPGPDGKVRVGW